MNHKIQSWAHEASLWLSIWNSCVLVGDTYTQHLNNIHLSFPFLLNAYPFHMKTERKQWFPERTSHIYLILVPVADKFNVTLLSLFGLGQLNLSFSFLLLDHNVYVPKDDAGLSFRLNPFFSRTLNSKETWIRVGEDGKPSWTDLCFQTLSLFREADLNSQVDLMFALFFLIK